MIENWTNLIETAIQSFQSNYATDATELINEDDLKYKVRNEIEKLSAPEYDMLIKSEVPWYDKDANGLKPKFFFDLAIMRKSKFELRFRDQEMRRKGYYYDDSSMVIMLKFAKPKFALKEIQDDLNKLVIFAHETKDQAKNHKPILIIGATDDHLFEQVENSIVDAVSSLDKKQIDRISIFYFNRKLFKRYDCEE